MDRDRTNGEQQAGEAMGGEALRYYEALPQVWGDFEALAQVWEEQIRRTPGEYSPRREPLPEKETAARAVEAVREVRRELWGDREPEGSAPSYEDVEKWERSREERRKQEGYQPH
jgi:hypothetical protein